MLILPPVNRLSMLLGDPGTGQTDRHVRHPVGLVLASLEMYDVTNPSFGHQHDVDFMSSSLYFCAAHQYQFLQIMMSSSDCRVASAREKKAGWKIHQLVALFVGIQYALSKKTQVRIFCPKAKKLEV